MLVDQYKNNIYIIDKSTSMSVKRMAGKSAITVNTSGTTWTIVASYSTFERAKEVFAELINFIKSDNPVYEMPEE